MSTVNASPPSPDRDPAPVPASLPRHGVWSGWPGDPSSGPLAAAGHQPAGYAALCAELGITDYTPQHQTLLAASLFGGRHAAPQVNNDGQVLEILPGRTALAPGLAGQMLFALKHDGVDLEALRRVFAVVHRDDVELAVRAQPASTPARRLWFAYEWITGSTLDVPPALKLKHVPFLDPDRYVTCEQRRSSRHGIIVNCLGTSRLCPTIRRTTKLEHEAAQQPLARLDRLVAEIDPALARRINDYLMIRESKGSFAIEGITADQAKDEVFFGLLNRLAQHPRPRIDAALLHDYQNQLVEPHAQERSGAYRRHQVWVGDRRGYAPIPAYIAPAPGDVPSYMTACCDIANWLGDAAAAGRIDPVIAGATSSGLFTYVHPFMDGNGRLSRLLLQQPISREPDAQGRRLFLPVSAAILRRQGDYYRALDVWSRQVLRSIRYTVEDGGVRPEHPTTELYRFPDLTAYAEFIYQAANDAVTTDIPAERAILSAFDRIEPTLSAAGLDRGRCDLFFRIAKQNGWRISQRKRHLFPEISDAALTDIETSMLGVVAPSEPPPSH